MKLLFCYLSERIQHDKAGKRYVSGNFTDEVWKRYTSLADEVSVVMTLEHDYLANDKIQGFHCIDDKDFKLYTVPHTTRNLSSFISRKNNKIKHDTIEKLIKTSDVVITRTIDAFIFAICKKYNKPYAVEVVGCVWDSYWNHSMYGKILAIPEFVKWKKYIKESSYVLYVTEKFLQHRYPTKGKSVYASNVILKMPSEEILKKRINKINEKKEKLIIGTAAAVDVRYKGQEFVIKALAKMKRNGDTRFIYQLVGGGNPDFIMKMAKKYNVDDQVQIIGRLNHDDVLNWLQNIDIYVQPSLQEGLPRSVIEAMGYAVPCIGSRVAGIPELLDSDMLFEKKKYKQLAKLLQNISVEKLKKMSERNFYKAQEYDAEVLNARRSEFYKMFLKESAKNE